jgi:hypothetical protein
VKNEVIGKLQRWTASGAIWRVAARTGDSVTIDLITCTGNEVAEKITSRDPELLAWLGSRGGSETPL